jgi:hypothetical protein
MHNKSTFTSTGSNTTKSSKEIKGFAFAYVSDRGNFKQVFFKPTFIKTQLKKILKTTYYIKKKGGNIKILNASNYDLSNLTKKKIVPPSLCIICTTGNNFQELANEIKKLAIPFVNTNGHYPNIKANYLLPVNKSKRSFTLFKLLLQITLKQANLMRIISFANRRIS